MKIRITGPAQKDLRGIWRYTRQRWGDEQADEYLLQLENRIHWLSQHRGLWIERADIREGLYAYSEGRHLILYIFRGEVLTVLRVLHTQMDVRRHLR